MKTFLIACLLYSSAVYADENWIITPDVRKACAEQGGCILTLPDGQLVPFAVIKQALQDAYDEGAKAGQQVCKRREI